MKTMLELVFLITMRVALGAVTYAGDLLILMAYDVIAAGVGPIGDTPFRGPLWTSRSGGHGKYSCRISEKPLVTASSRFPGLTLSNPLPRGPAQHKFAGMSLYFDIHDRARLPGRFYGESLSVTARL
ncbi:MAG: hypothetical protein ACK5LJ_15205 [Paracoccus sp. (in: a-proteobacteria)]